MSRRNSMSRVKSRVRRDSGTKLDYYYSVINKTILLHQVIQLHFRLGQNRSFLSLKSISYAHLISSIKNNILRHFRQR